MDKHSWWYWFASLGCVLAVNGYQTKILEEWLRGFCVGLANDKLRRKCASNSSVTSQLDCLAKVDRLVGASSNPSNVCDTALGRSTQRLEVAALNSPLVHLQKNNGIWLAAIVKNQAADVFTWVVYHSGLGIEHIVIYDNDSDDGLEIALQPFIQASFVTVLKVHGLKQQTPSYSNASHIAFKAGARWLITIDIDEFVVIKNNTLDALLSHVPEQCDSLQLNWAILTPERCLYRPRVARRPSEVSNCPEGHQHMQLTWDPGTKAITRLRSGGLFYPTPHVARVNAVCNSVLKVMTNSDKTNFWGSIQFVNDIGTSVGFILHRKGGCLEEYLNRIRRGVPNPGPAFRVKNPLAFRTHPDSLPIALKAWLERDSGEFATSKNQRQIPSAMAKSYLDDFCASATRSNHLLSNVR